MTAIDSESIADIVKNIWDSVLAIEVCATEPEQHEGGWHESAQTACVQISGGWTGVVSARFTPELATASGAAMLGIDPLELGPDDLRDALGELANMIGGNIKALLPQPSSLSLPWVTTGDGYSLEFPHCRVVQRVAMTSGEGTVLVTVLAANPPAHA